MMERRLKRSCDRTEALQYLVEAVADRSRVDALLLVDDAGRMIAGTGAPRDLPDLAAAAPHVAWRRSVPAHIDAIAVGRDMTARGFATPEGMLYFAALGDRVAGVGDAVRAALRIVSETAR
jgi:hypothetical protein